MTTSTTVAGLVTAARRLNSVDLHTLICQLQRLEASGYGLDEDLDVLETLANKNALA